VIAERCPLQAGRVEHVNHLFAGQRLAVDAGGAEGRRREVVAAERDEKGRPRAFELGDHRGHARQPAVLAAFNRADLVHVVEVRDRDDGGSGCLRCDIRRGERRGDAGDGDEKNESKIRNHALRTF